MDITYTDSCAWDLDQLNLHTDLQYDDSGQAQKFRTILRLSVSKKVYNITNIGELEYEWAEETSLNVRINGDTSNVNIDPGSDFTDLYLFGHTINPLGEQGTGYSLITKEFIAGPLSYTWEDIDWSLTTPTSPLPTITQSVLPEDNAKDSGLYQWDFVGESLDVQTQQGNADSQMYRKRYQIKHSGQLDKITAISGLQPDLLRVAAPSAPNGGFNQDVDVDIATPDEVNPDFGSWIVTDWTLIPYGSYGGGMATNSITYETNSKYKWFGWT